MMTLRTAALCLVGVAQAWPMEAIFRLGSQPLGLMSYVFGTAQSPMGGMSFPLDSRWFTQTPRRLLTRTLQQHPSVDPRCQALFEKKPEWSARSSTKSASYLMGDTNSQAVLALVDRPEEIQTWEPEELACLFYLGYSPPRIPEGLASGHVYDTLNNPALADVAQALWSGNLVVNFRCDNGNKGDPQTCKHTYINMQTYTYTDMQSYTQTCNHTHTQTCKHIWYIHRNAIRTYIHILYIHRQPLSLRRSDVWGL